MRVAVIQLAYGDDESMPDRVARAADLVRAQAEADLVILPELWSATGFGYRQWQERAEPLDGPIAQAMAAAAQDAGVLLHAGSMVERLAQPGAEGRDLANTSLIFAADGELVATYQKVHRFGFGAGEPVLMEAGDTLSLIEVDDGQEAATLSLSTCYDLRFPELYRAQLDAGATVFLVPAAWPAARVEHWSLLGRARAMENQCFLIAANTAGTHANTTMGGRSQVVAPDGEVLAEAGEAEEVLTVEVDLNRVALIREEFPVLNDRRWAD
ncbi:MAG: carbon-nitrogen family hydrolase [Nostocoides sp.]